MDVMRIIDLNGKYALITAYGYILHTEKRYDDMISYCQEQFNDDNYFDKYSGGATRICAYR